MPAHRNCVHCIVPPHMLRRVAQRGSERQRKWALRSLSADVTMRQARAVNAKVRDGGPREGADALAATTRTAPKPNRIIWDAGNEWEVSGLPRARSEGDSSTGDAAVDEAYDGLGDTWRFWREVFSRESIDGENMPLRGVVSTSARTTTTRSGTAAA
jgi:Zn-dependent metalloprotease